ncbi:MAG: TetR/AcrR family transcriptional regulator [Capsulimonadales bacterium]|nr:TetR/AcrR family transcriptional regulator [Capsulimonadales bacterium]
MEDTVNDSSEAARPKEHRSELRRDLQRERILEAARTALIRIGYERITTRDIAREAGVNIATLHYYFGTKETLLSEAVTFTLEQTLAEVRAAIEGAPDVTTALERAFHYTWEIVRKRPGVLRYDLLVRGMRDPLAHQQVLAIYDALHGLIGEILQRHTDTGRALRPGLTMDRLRNFLVAGIDGVILQHLVYGDEEKTVGTLKLIHEQARYLLDDGTVSVPGAEPANGGEGAK